MSRERELEVACAAVREAARLCEDVRAEMVTPALTKEDRSPVTVADFGAQALICRTLAAEFPADPVVGEEDAAALRKPDAAATREAVAGFVARYAPDASAKAALDWIDHGNGAVSPRYWTLDPIDGTKGFLRKDQYAVALALVEGGSVQVAVLACPGLPLDPLDPGGARGVLFAAVRGRGATAAALRSGVPRAIRVADGGDPRAWRLVESVESGHGHHSLQEQVALAVGVRGGSVRMDSQAKYGAVARGEAALYLRLPSPRTPDYRENVWDHAAGVLVVEEAGGRVTDIHGRRLDFAGGTRMVDNRGVVVSNGPIHDRVLAELAGIF
jgi:3'(2'), 5'-bisphosphate nucleotidase